ncbi:hypothetical protein CLAFUW4_11986 [Fulvia fulva]|uniref:Uncharacterized protein n=1 Tax=Passalora fulva TaxID=5499 RepID=A0A9Q8PEA1_PASFU|nr:uncharacterized protein CLAFUR5_11027 [Fulvia fulva]KAK4618230.1 hypothetical protein CLAFUR4_11991 [Fulvia fulva]KAK4619177.1 hypothetical protein CLAFUR0_12002 [Fulvia fulva]UJO20840.1 hypothetical protein CLAFUR5_11027 [Fulvia fulva]WPV18337.1 hypothetical protein CLAFUW4_11986 [Fulvia fulva]WPV33582.1 hypothetical protein CLAFUW7_11993 [Fulvia fulva]
MSAAQASPRPICYASTSRSTPSPSYAQSKIVRRASNFAKISLVILLASIEDLLQALSATSVRMLGASITKTPETGLRGRTIL